MAIQRKVKVDLSIYDVDWKSSYLVFATKGFRETIEIGKAFRKLGKNVDIADREVEKLANKEVYGEEAEKAEEEAIKASDELFNFMAKILEEKFLSGKVLDGEEMRDAKKEDIQEFDMEIIEKIMSVVTGTVGKKA